MIERKITRSDTLLYNALCNVIKTKSLESITVTDLCKEATLHRTTFYSRFETLEDFYRYVVFDIWSKYYKEVENTHIDKNDRYQYAYIHSLESYRMYLKHKELAPLFVKYADIKLFKGSYNTTKPDLINDDFYFNYLFLQYGATGITKEWVENGFKEPPEEMANKMARIIIKLLDMANAK